MAAVIALVGLVGIWTSVDASLVKLHSPKLGKMFIEVHECCLQSPGRQKEGGEQVGACPALPRNSLSPSLRKKEARADNPISL